MFLALVAAAILQLSHFEATTERAATSSPKEYSEYEETLSAAEEAASEHRYAESVQHYRHAYELLSPEDRTSDLGAWVVLRSGDVVLEPEFATPPTELPPEQTWSSIEASRAQLVSDVLQLYGTFLLTARAASPSLDTQEHRDRLQRLRELQTQLQGELVPPAPPPERTEPKPPRRARVLRFHPRTPRATRTREKPERDPLNLGLGIGGAIATATGIGFMGVGLGYVRGSAIDEEARARTERGLTSSESLPTELEDWRAGERGKVAAWTVSGALLVAGGVSAAVMAWWRNKRSSSASAQASVGLLPRGAQVRVDF